MTRQNPHDPPPPRPPYQRRGAAIASERTDMRDILSVILIILAMLFLFDPITIGENARLIYDSFLLNPFDETE